MTTSLPRVQPALGMRATCSREFERCRVQSCYHALSALALCSTDTLAVLTSRRYLTAGFFEKDDTIPLLLALQEGGADVSLKHSCAITKTCLGALVHRAQERPRHSRFLRTGLLPSHRCQLLRESVDHLRGARCRAGHRSGSSIHRPDGGRHNNSARERGRVCHQPRENSRVVYQCLSVRYTHRHKTRARTHTHVYINIKIHVQVCAYVGMHACIFHVCMHLCVDAYKACMHACNVCMQVIFAYVCVDGWMDGWRMHARTHVCIFVCVLQVALANGIVGPNICLSVVKEARKQGLTVPVVLMGYCNPFIMYQVHQ